MESSRRQWRSRAVVSGGVGQGAAVEWDSGEVRKGTTRSQVKGGKGVAMQSRGKANSGRGRQQREFEKGAAAELGSEHG